MILNYNDSQQSSLKKIKKMEKLQKYKKRFKRLAICCLLIDTIAFIISILLKYFYTLHIDNEFYDLSMMIIKLLIQIIVSFCIALLIIKEVRLMLLLSMALYIILGTVYALSTLFYHLTKDNISKKMKPLDVFASYYTNLVYVYVIIFSSVSWLSKAIASISIILFYLFNENFEHEFEVNTYSESVLYNRKVDLNSNYKHDNEYLIKDNLDKLNTSCFEKTINNSSNLNTILNKDKDTNKSFENTYKEFKSCSNTNNEIDSCAAKRSYKEEIYL